MSKSYSSTKSTLIDEVHSGCKASVIAAEAFVQNRNGLSEQVKQNTDALKALTSNHKNLEEQVKAIARVLNSSNLPKMAENIKLAQDEHARQVAIMLNEKEKAITAMVEHELETVVSAKKGIWARIADTEQQILSTVAHQLEEARLVREANKDNIAKLVVDMDKFSSVADENRKAIKMIEYKFVDLKKDFRTFESTMENEVKLKDNEVSHKVTAALETAKETILDESKTLSKMISKREAHLAEEVATVKELLERESANRVDGSKGLTAVMNESLAKMKADTDKKFGSLESGVDHKVRAFAASMQEAMRVIEQEATHRDLADQDLARRLAKESSERHHDEEKLVTLISTIQAAVSKMNTAA